MIPFSSCSDDDEEISSSNLIGTWQYTGGKFWEIIDGEKETWEEDGDDDEWIMTFKEDGTMIEWDGFSNETYEWKLNGNKLILDGDEFTVKTLTSNKLVLEIHEKDSDGDEFLDQYSFKKIN